MTSKFVTLESMDRVTISWMSKASIRRVLEVEKKEIKSVI